jgi:hypothetical protein
MRLGSVVPAALCLLAVAACQHDDYYDPPMPDLPPAPTATRALDPASLTAPRWEAAMVAGDVTLHAHDDAVASLQQELQTAGVPLERLHTFSADRQQYEGGVEGSGVHGGDRSRRDRDELPDDDPNRPKGERELRSVGTIEPARAALVLRRLMALDGRRGGACIAYFGSKVDGGDLHLLYSDISPEQLDRALGAGCVAAPTVVIVSGCNTGAFAQSPVARPNRLILAAARQGASGFGCGPNLALTTFDECLLGSILGAGDWADAFDRTKRCVTRREDLVGQPHVEPESAIGAAVASLPIPGQESRAAATEIRFRPGVGRFTVDDAPYFSALKARTHAAFEAYAHAPVPKALALTLAGTVTWAAAEHGESSDDVARIALQRCEWQSSGACILYARDGHLATLGGGGVPDIHPPLLIRAGRLTPADAPFIRTDQRAAIADYLALPGIKALALAPDGEISAVGTGATPVDARDAALRKCSVNGAVCRVFAEQDRIVLGYQ